MAKYTLPVATENILGGVKIGQGIDVTQDGVISIHEYPKINTTIQELTNSVQEGKSLIAEAITEKKVPTSADSTFQTMASNIRSIPTGNEYTLVREFRPAVFNVIKKYVYIKLYKIMED